MGDCPYHDIKVIAQDGTIVAVFEHVDAETRDELINKIRMSVGTRIEIVCTCNR